jgi:hypothetical protein
MSQYRLRADYGNQAFGEHGVRHGFKAGSIFRSAEMVPAATQGAHNMEEDSLVLEFSDEARSIGEDGLLKISPTMRRVSFALKEFDPANPARLFDEVNQK